MELTLHVVFLSSVPILILHDMNYYYIHFTKRVLGLIETKKVVQGHGNYSRYRAESEINQEKHRGLYS